MATGSVSMKGDELFILTLADLACYVYGMHNCHDARHSPGSPEIRRRPLPPEIISDGTKLSIEANRPKTTTGGINCYFRLYSISQNPARHSLQADKLNQYATLALARNGKRPR